MGAIMKIIEPSFEILDKIDGQLIIESIERIGRTCYKSENKITTDSARSFVSRIIKSGHESVIEHEKFTVKIICDRGVSHEIVRHRIASYSQESTRYCNYYTEKFGNELTVIKPFFWNDDPEKYNLWLEAIRKSEQIYNELVELGAKPEEARSVLPNSLKTEIVVTMNLREWRHFFKMRTAASTHPQMREIAIPLLHKVKEMVPVVFDDINCT